MSERGSGTVGGAGRGYTRRETLRAGAGAVVRGPGALATAGLGWVSRERVAYVAIGHPRRDDVADRVADAGFSVRRAFAGGSVLLVAGDPGSERELGAVSGVVDAVRDRPLRRRRPVDRRSGGAAVGADDLTDRQWDKAVTAAFRAHETATGEGTTIAVIDSGIHAAHPELERNVNVAASRRVDEGRLQPSRGRDGLGHGTFVAGVAAASDGEEAGVVGMAPDAELVSVSPSFGGTGLLDVVASMEYAADIGADVMNLSLGVLVNLPPRVERALRRLVERYALFASPRTVTVIAAGNHGIDASPGSGAYDFPGSIESALTVGATGPDDERTFYSTYGGAYVDLGAPGGGYGTATRTYCEVDDDGDDGGQVAAGVPPGGAPEATAGEPCELPAYPYPTNQVYGPVPPESLIARLSGYGGERYAYLGGTSFAAPQVAGVVALVREVAPELPAQRVEEVVTGTADPVSGENAAELGAGRLNAARAVEAARRAA